MSMRIGVVDLCTSHPASFIPILREMGCEITAVWDSGETRSPEFLRSFAEQFEIPHVCDSLDDMVGHVDAVTIHGANWDNHLAQASLFVKAGIPMCIDKPMVGSLGDVKKLLQLDRKKPGLIFGGSACQFAQEVDALHEQMSDAGPVVSAFAIGHADLFSYGIHTIELAQAILGYDAESVMCINEKPLGHYLVRFSRGFDLILQAYNPKPGWHVMVNTFEKGVMTSGIDLTKLYQPFLRRFLDFAGGDAKGWSLENALQPVRVALAIEKSHQQPGKWVSLDSLNANDKGFDGAAFASAYGAARDKGESIYIHWRDQLWADALEQMSAS